MPQETDLARAAIPVRVAAMKVDSVRSFLNDGPRRRSVRTV